MRTHQLNSLSNLHQDRQGMSPVLLCAYIMLCLFVVGMLTGCITVEGQSSGKMKKTLEKSFLFTSAKSFYPNGVTDSPEKLPELDSEAVKNITSTYQRILESMLKQHENQNHQLGVIFQRPLDKTLRSRVVISNTPFERGLPLARMEADGSLVLSTKVAQSMYRTAILYGMTSEEPGGMRFMSNDIKLFGKRAETEKELIEQFNLLAKKVSEVKGKSILGDVIDIVGSAIEDEDEDTTWSVMADMGMTSTIVEQHYTAPIRFLIGHELGHTALGHFSSSAMTSVGVDQALCQRQEMEADIYSFALMTTTPEYQQVLASGVAGLGDSFFLFGHNEFFGSTYDLARFAPPAAQDSAQCHYESAKERRIFLELVKAKTIASGKNLTLTEIMALKASRTAGVEGASNGQSN